MRDKTFLIMAGGTGGHVYPALATAQGLLARHEKVIWMGARGGMEERVIGQTGIPFYGLSVKGVRGKSLLVKLSAPFRILRSVFEAWKVIRATKPDCVLGMGGYASGPGGIAARLSRKPLVIHEQNAVAGMTNRILSKLASRVLEAFPQSFGALDKAELTGNPLREPIVALHYRDRADIPVGQKVKVLILGGSLGAESLNICVPEALACLSAELRPEVWHQTGEKNFEITQKRYEDSGVVGKVIPYIDDMAQAYSWADFVICRAGALTVSELCTVGLGAILVPYPHAVDDHQTRNAQFMVDAGAAWLLPQTQLNPKALAEILEPLLARPERITRLGQAARKIARPEATDKVVQVCLQEAR